MTQQVALDHSADIDGANTNREASVTAKQGAKTSQSLNEPWEKICANLRAVHGAQTFDNWMASIRPGELAGSTLVLALPNRFMANYVKANYVDSIREQVRKELPVAQDVRLIVKTMQGAPKPQAQAAAESTTKDRLSTPLDERLTFDSFVVGKPNEFCYAAAKKVAEGKTDFNPLFVHGGVGLGKTHILQAIAWEFKQRKADARVIYMSAERFMYRFINALRYDTILKFKQEMRSADLLLIDDVQFLAGKESTQEEFFHTFNYLIDNARQMVISADRSPADLTGVEERIRSRLSWGLVADVHPMDYELRLGILQSKAQKLQHADVGEDVLQFLARNITSNARELEGALIRITAHAQLLNKPVTLDLTRDVLQDVLRANHRRITVKEIQRQVADHYAIRVNDMLSSRRTRNLVRPRQVAMFLAKQLTTRSLPEIAREFHGKDHTTVMYAVRRVEELRQTDSDLDNDLTLLRRRLEA
ncbi:MAG: chromosomal replication initiator protein DnaA [Sphingomonadales bacterium]|jgi:chromosomal replication initiator protein